MIKAQSDQTQATSTSDVTACALKINKSIKKKKKENLQLNKSPGFTSPAGVYRCLSLKPTKHGTAAVFYTGSLLVVYPH